MVPQMREKPRTRLLGLDEWKRLLEACGDDRELRCFLILAATMTCRKSEILQRRWAEVHLAGDFPCMEIPVTKNSDPKIVPLTTVAVEALKKLPSLEEDEYVFPAKPNPCYSNPSKFKKFHRWDIRKRFMAVCKKAGISNLHIHDLRHLYRAS